MLCYLLCNCVSLFCTWMPVGLLAVLVICLIKVCLLMIVFIVC